MTPTLSLTVLLAVAIGGAAGSVLRYVTGVWLTGAPGGFPWATLLVNVAGAFLIGYLARTMAHADPALRLALTAGFCGGFTTFSTFSAETLLLVQQGRIGRAVLYVTMSLVLGLLATALGLGATPGTDRGTSTS